jgi:transposase-like protein
MIFSGLSPLVVDEVADEGEVIRARARTAAGSVACPDCGAGSTRVHAYHERFVDDVAVDARRVLVVVRVRRLVCSTDGCRRTFREQVPGVLERYQRRTNRLAGLVGVVVTELAGRAGVRVLTAMAVTMSRQTAIRALQRLPPPAMLVPRVLGVDDFALRKRLGSVALLDRSGQDGPVKLPSRRRAVPASDSAFAGFRFPAAVIVLAVRWYLRYGLSYRDVEELLHERGVEVDHVTVYRWVQRFTPLLADAARFARHSPGDRWFVDETYVKVNGVWRYVYRAVDQDGQVIDVLVSARRDADAAHRFFRRALDTLKVTPVEVVTDAAAVYPRVLDELVPAAWHHVERWANNRIEADHSRLKQRLRPMRGLRTDRTATVIIAGLAFLQNLRRGHYELAVDLPSPLRIAAAFTELARAI